MSTEAPARTGTSKKKKIQTPAWDPTFEPLVAELVASNSVKIRPAVEVGRRAVEYFRATDLVKWVAKNEEGLRDRFPDCFDDPSVQLTAKQAQELAETLCRLGFIYRAHYKPISDRPATTAAAAGAESPSDTGKVESTIPKWPKRLEMSQDQRFDVNEFYVLCYEPKSHWPKIYLTAVIMAVLVVCLFPAWPLAMKLVTWYSSVIFMTFIMSSVILRLFTFLLLWFVGVDFWIFPNLFDEELGVIDSFKPLYSWFKRDDDWSMFAARIFLGILMIGTGYQLSQTHSLSDIHRFTTQQFLDVLDWGHQKLAAPPTSDIAVPFKATPEAILDPTEGFRCLQPCGFDSYETFKEECSYDCSCMGEMLNSHCFTKCPEAAKTSLKESQVEACKYAGHDSEEL